MSDEEKIERLRLHLEHHKNRDQAFFSIAGVQTVLEQRDALKTQVERLLSKEADKVSAALMEKQTFVEAVARAIAEAGERNGGPPYEVRVTMSKWSKAHLLEEAEAAIEVMLRMVKP